MESLIRFSPLVRQGLKFRKRFEAAKQTIASPSYPWYPYDSFANLFYLQILMKRSGLSLDRLAGDNSLLDMGAADGALSFFFESLGFDVECWDHAATNMNGMAALHDIGRTLGSRVATKNIDMDAAFDFTRRFDLCLFLGTLYHLRNPFYALEKLASHVKFCFLSTRIARQSPDGTLNFENLPIAYLVDADQCNHDATNYWIFSPAGLNRLTHRAGWDICASATAGPSASRPDSPDADERMFLLLQSRHV
jgi:2-polyprenyl-3-methyl-5-hydroxy-6-metoxy-1,4-benzoquinol methylase